MENFERDKAKDIFSFKKREEKLKNELWFFQRWFFVSKYEEQYKKFNRNIKNDIVNKIKSRKVILFFDEINTSNSLGTVKRLICDENFRTKINIPDRFIIICACNPYRFLKEENQNLQFGLSYRNKKQRKLVYTVNPLPYSLLNFVLYFNDLSKETIKKYIEKAIENIKCQISSENKELIKLLVCESHFFIKEKGDISSISLREINRFGKIFEFFYEKYLKIYRKYRNQNLEQNEFEKKVISLSIYIAYYLRLPSTKLRDNYISSISKVIGKNTIEFKSIFEEESQFITNNVLEGKKGYAKNKGLCENIFSEFICILMREPLIICGKPGSSKSLSVRLLLNAMKGEKSHINFFKQFPEVIPTFYQCSLISTSEHLIKVFEKARNKLKRTDYKIISLIFMDEMGIADESENNPLKVMHSELDENSWIKEEKEKIAFIGISNWSLDASKMNRTINIVVEDPDLNYIEETAKEIIRAININFLEDRYEKIFKSISKAYLDYLDVQKKYDKKDFHGFRDFYYLIKYIFNNISENNGNDDNYFIDVVAKGIYRNFGGFENSEIYYLDKFLQNYTKEKYVPIRYNVLNRIKDNIESKIESRYLLLITKEDSMNEIILKYVLGNMDYEIISDENIDKCGDNNNQILNLLLRIEFLMNKEIILILKNLDILYPCLYELFNKNFSEYGKGNKFVQISYQNNHSLIQVNEKFRIIVLVKEEKLNEEEKPFLNRLEKQIFSFQKILNNKEINIIESLYNNIEKIKIKIGYSHLDYLNRDLLYFLMVKYYEKEKDALKFIFKELVPLFSQEMIYCLNNDKEIMNIFDEYIKNEINLIFENHYKMNYNFRSYLSNINSLRNVIYTYSNTKTPPIVDGILSNYKNKYKLVNIKVTEIDEKKLSDFILYNTHEKRIDEKKVEELFIDEDEEINLYIIKMHEKIIMNDDKNIFIKNLILCIEKYSKYKNIKILYIIYMNRENQINKNTTNSKEILQLFLPYNQIFIDNFDNKILYYENIEMFCKNIINIEKILENTELMKKQVLDKVFDSIVWKIENELNFNYKNVQKIKIGLRNNDHILNIILNKIKYLINVKLLGISEILSKRKKNEDFIKSLYYQNMHLICDLFVNIINYLEDELTLSTALFSNLSSEEEKKKLENDFKGELDKFDENKNYNGIKYIYIGFNLVGLFKDYKKLNNEISNRNNNTKINIKESIILNPNYQIKKKLDSNNNEEKKFLFNDYILFYISLVINIKGIEKTRKEIIKFLNQILKLCILELDHSYLDDYYFIDIIFQKKLSLVKYLEDMCIFLENNKEFLSKILSVLNDFLVIIPNFNEIFRNLYCKKRIKENNLSEIFEVFLDCINDEFKFSFYFNEDTREKYIELLNKNEDILKNALSLIDKNDSISMLNIEIFLLIIKREIGNNELLKNILEYLRTEKINNFENNKILIKEIINNLNDKDFLNISIKQYLKNKKNLEIIDIFLSKKNFEKYSLLFFENILGEYLNKDVLLLDDNKKNNFLNIPKELEEKINNILKKDEKNLFMEIIIYYFECFYENYYFKKFEEEKDKKKRYEKILKNFSLYLCKNYLDDTDNNNNITLHSLYKFGFIKIYLKYFVNIMYENDNGNEYIDFSELVKDKFLHRKINVIEEIKNNLKIKCMKDNKNIEEFISKNKIFYLEKEYYDEHKANYSKINYISNVVPSIQLLKIRFNSEVENKKKYPFLNQFLNNEIQIEYLKNLPIINKIANAMLASYNYKSIDEIKKITIAETENYFNKDFQTNILKYIISYNSLLNFNNIEKDHILEDGYKDQSVNILLVNEKNDNNHLITIYQKFIEYQNDFITNISEIYFKNIGLEEINVQDADERNVPQFSSLDGEFLKIILNNTEMHNINTNESDENEIGTFKFIFQEMENDLSEKIKLGLKRFKKEGIRTMKYNEDINKEIINEFIIDDFLKRYKPEDLEGNQKNNIRDFIKNNNLEKSNDLLLSIQNLMLFILEQSKYKDETDIQKVINDISENDIDNNMLKLIKSFFNCYILEEEDDDEDILNEMNQSQNDDIRYSINNLYGLFEEIKKLIK